MSHKKAYQDRMQKFRDAEDRINRANLERKKHANDPAHDDKPKPLESV